MNWIDLFLEECDKVGVETPKPWLYWSALATISAVVAPNVSVNKGAYKVKPNLYIMLVGRSGLGKGFGPYVAEKLVTMVGNTRVISGKGTIEGMIKEMAHFKANPDGSLPYKDARAFICSSEFAASLYNSTDALTVLTDLYDSPYKEEWRNYLKNSSGEKLKFPCITMLSGANQDMFDLAIDKAHKGGGFVGRTLLIEENKRYRSNSMIYRKGQEIPKVDFERLACHLKDISKLQGDIEWSNEAADIYDEWFYPFRKLETDDKTGTYERLNDHVIKVIACLTVANNKSMEIGPDEVYKAIELCSTLPNTARNVAGMKGSSATKEAGKAFLTHMLSATDYTLTRQQALQKGWGDYDSVELDRIVETFTQAEWVVQPSGGKVIKYKLTKKFIDWWKKKQKEME